MDDEIDNSTIMGWTNEVSKEGIKNVWLMIKLMEDGKRDVGREIDWTD